MLKLFYNFYLASPLHIRLQVKTFVFQHKTNASKFNRVGNVVIKNQSVNKTRHRKLYALSLGHLFLLWKSWCAKNNMFIYLCVSCRKVSYIMYWQLTIEIYLKELWVYNVNWNLYKIIITFTIEYNTLNSKLNIFVMKLIYCISKYYIANT